MDSALNIRNKISRGKFTAVFYTMSGSYRRIIFIFALVGMMTIAAAIGYGLAEQAGYSNRAYQQSVDYAEEAAKQITQSCLRLARVEQSKCLNEGADKYRIDAHDKQREYNDLIAQRKSALWAMITGIAGLIGTAISVAGVLLVLTTFRETQKATKAARDAADSAEKTLHASRAWMLFMDVDTHRFSGHVSDVSVRNGIIFNIYWSNYGQGPAVNVCGLSHVTQIDLDEECPTFEREMRSDLSGVIGPGKSVSLSVYLTDEMTKKFEDKQMRTFIYSKVVYRDIFSENERVTEYCAEVTYNGERVSGQSGERAMNFGIVPTGPQNTAT